MAAWVSDRLSDFLPFSLDTYYSLSAIYNAGFRYVVVLGILVGLAALLLLRRPTDRRVRLVLAGVGLSWLWISWAYLIETLAPLLWAAELFALAFALQSGLLLATAALATELLPPLHTQPRRELGLRLGHGLLAFSVLLLPLLELAAGRVWSGLSLFGSAGVPTSIGTLGLAAMLRPAHALLLMPIPALWCVIAALMQLGLGDPLWWLPALAVLIGLVSALLGRQMRLGLSARPGS